VLEEDTMVSGQELQVQEKRELQKKEESTAPVRMFLPTTDIYETDQALTVVMEMPGVDKEKVEINVEDGVLTVEGRIDFSKYEALQPVYTEYNIGNFRRSFDLSNSIDQDKIRADMKDGVLTLTLPKAEQAKPRKIAVA
jgi:HSP20 family protein